MDDPETSFSHILDKIVSTMENRKDILGAIPDGPLPFRGFARALACLLKLGVVSQMSHGTAVRSNNYSSHHDISRQLEGHETVFTSLLNKLPLGWRMLCSRSIPAPTIALPGRLGSLEKMRSVATPPKTIPRIHHSTIEIGVWANSRLVRHVCFSSSVRQ